MLKTFATTIAELERDILLKFKLAKNTEFELKFMKNGKSIVLYDMEDLEDEVTIKASIPTFDPNANNCWWNTKPNQTKQWEQKDAKYFRCLLRDKKENVVDDGNEDLKKLEHLMPFFGGDINQVNKAYVLFNETLFDSFQYHRSFLLNEQRAYPRIFKKK